MRDSDQASGNRTDIDAARDIVANGFSVEAALEAGGDGRFYLTENFTHAVLFAQANPRGL